jgi:hypothetical protein
VGRRAALAAAKARGQKLGGPKLALATKLGNAANGRAGHPAGATERGDNTASRGGSAHGARHTDGARR